MANSVLEFVITARDEASDALKSVSASAAAVGTGFIAAGAAITGALALATKAAAEHQAAIANVNTTLADMTNTTVKVDTGMTQTVTKIKETGIAATLLRDSIQGAKDSIDSKRASLDALKARLEPTKLAQDEYAASTARLSAEHSKGKLTTDQYNLGMEKAKAHLESGVVSHAQYAKAVSDSQAQISKLTDESAKYGEELDKSKSKQVEVYKEVRITSEMIDQARKSITGAANAATMLGFSVDDSALSLTKMYQRTGDVNEAVKLNNLAMDLARAKHLDLSTASNLVNLALSGNGRMLKQYGIDIKDSATPLEALGVLQEKVGGQAQAFSKTFEGATQAFWAQFNLLMIAVGDKLLPILSNLLTNHIIPITQRLIAWTSAHPELTRQIVIIVGVVGLLLTAVGSLLVMLPLLIGFFLALLSPVGLVAVAIVALGAAATAVILNWDKLKAWFESFWPGWVKSFKDSVDAVVSFLQPVINMINTVSSGIAGVASKVGGAIGGAFTAVAGARASGGPVSGGSAYLVGEKGPELFTPGSGGFITPNGGGGGLTINMSVTGTFMSEDAAEKMGDLIVRRLQRVSRISLQ